MSAHAPDSALEQASPQAVLEHMLERFHPRLALACSFQKEESVLVDMLMRLEPGARVFTIDTGVLFEQTRETWRRFEEHWGVRVEVFDATSPDGAAWTEQRCCSEVKVAALDQALGGLDAWITGLRREQAPTRSAAPKLGHDRARGVWKASPLADWNERDVWSYIAEHDLPYHPLHDRGYASIGCAPCTRPGDGRQGRWADSEKTECGLHPDDRGMS